MVKKALLVQLVLLVRRVRQATMDRQVFLALEVKMEMLDLMEWQDIQACKALVASQDPKVHELLAVVQVPRALKERQAFLAYQAGMDCLASWVFKVYLVIVGQLALWENLGNEDQLGLLDLQEHQVLQVLCGKWLWLHINGYRFKRRKAIVVGQWYFSGQGTGLVSRRLIAQAPFFSIVGPETRP